MSNYTNNGNSAINEQSDGIVMLDGTARELAMLNAWRGSTAVFWARTAWPCAAVVFKVADAAAARYVASLTMLYHPKRGMWRVSVPAKWLSEKCETRYKVVCWADDRTRSVGGEGILRVHGSGVYDPDEDAAAPSGEDCYVSFPDGKWRKVTVFTDDAGELSFSVEQDGVDASAFEDAPTAPYAYNAATGLYHAVTGFVDEEGEAYLSVAAEGVDGKSVAFARNEATGLFYRVETFTDETGEAALKVGDATEAKTDGTDADAAKA